MAADKKDDKRKREFKFGPFEQALAVIVVMGFAANPSIPHHLFTSSHFNPLEPHSTQSGIPFLTPPLIILILIAYIGHHLLTRQSAVMDRQKALAKAAATAEAKAAAEAASASAASERKPLSSSDIRSKGMPSSSAAPKSGDPAPKKVSGGSSGGSGKDNPSSTHFKKNFFLTMQGPGRPALVPFQDGLRPKDGDEMGTMWWDNVPDDAAQLMAPPVDPSRMAAMMKNPWLPDIIEKDIQLLKLNKRKKEEEERYEKVASYLQTMLGFLLCAVDMRLGIVSTIFFLWRHYSALHAQDLQGEKDTIEEEKKELQKRVSEAKKAGADSSLIRQLMDDLQKL